ncbi:MAG: AAA family ATPase, partial [Desulfobacterales bacterium]|nr:AAA family ATPase [Desulfobacterales bacterium]
IIPRESLIMIAAPAGSYKSTLAYSLACSIGSGHYFADKKVKQGKVLYIDRENSKDVHAKRLPLIFNGHESVKLWAVYHKPQPPLLTGEGFQHYIQFSKDFDVLIFDSLRKYHRHEENSSTEMERVMTNLLKLRDLGCTVIFLHHSGKSELQKYRGSEEILAATDLAFNLNRDKDIITLECIKNRFSPENKINLKVIWDQVIRFESALDPRMKIEEGNLNILKNIIHEIYMQNGKWPNQSSIVELAKSSGMAKHQVLSLLSKGEQRDLWKIQKGQKNSTLYEIPVFQFSNHIYSQKTGKLKKDNTERIEESVPWKNHSIN